MMQSVLSYLGAVGIGSLVAVLVPPFLAHFLARKRFVEERWWERRADAYITLLDALYDMHRFDEAEAEDLLHINELSEARRAELVNSWGKGWREIDKAFRVGRVMISRDAYDSIRKVLECHRGIPEDDCFRLVDTEGAAVKNCIGELSAAATRDLGVKVSVSSV
jgi:hypothetical protein